MKSFEIVSFDKLGNQTLNMKCGLKKNFSGDEKQTEAEVLRLAKAYVAGGIYYLSWKYEGIPRGVLINFKNSENA